MEAVAPDRQLAGRYTLVEQIGAGGMATVWRAEDSVLARAVAVKVLRDPLASDAALLERFRREAVGAARLAHPNIVRVYDAGTDGEHSFIVMEYVPGRTLRALLDEQGALDPPAAAGVTIGILSALACAHAAGVLHRDIRPGNILIAPGGLVKVTDFGLAAAAFGDKDLETTGELLGTVGYVAPEQVQGGDVTAATDIYAAGLVLSELLTGRRVFEGPTDLATAMARLTTRPAAPSAIRPGIPRALDQVVARATALRPDERYPSADGMRAALERFAGPSDRPLLPPPRSAEPAAPPPTGRSSLRAWMLVPLVVVVVAAAVIAGGLALGRLSIGGPLGIQAASPSPASTGAVALERITIASATSEDPQGPDGTEHPDQARLAIDGDPATVWTTDHYQTADFGNLKTGVGLWLEFDATSEVHTVTITSPLPGWTFQVFASPDGPGTSATPLASPDGRSTFTSGAGTLTVTLRPERAPGVLIWITGLAPDGARYAASIAEVSVRGTP
jgi:eukaryotic-like serine/threonine-protein kinase